MTRPELALLTRGPACAANTAAPAVCASSLVPPLPAPVADSDLVPTKRGTTSPAPVADADSQPTAISSSSSPPEIVVAPELPVATERPPLSHQSSSISSGLTACSLNSELGTTALLNSALDSHTSRPPSWLQQVPTTSSAPASALPGATIPFHLTSPSASRVTCHSPLHHSQSNTPLSSSTSLSSGASAEFPPSRAISRSNSPSRRPPPIMLSLRGPNTSQGGSYTDLLPTTPLSRRHSGDRIRKVAILNKAASTTHSVHGGDFETRSAHFASSTPPSHSSDPGQENQTILKRCTTIETDKIRSMQQQEIEQVNQYRMFQVLGRGAFGTVRLARDINSDNLFAVKCVSKRRLRRKTFGRAPGLASTRGPTPTRGPNGSIFDLTQQIDSMLGREVGILKRLDHPNIIRLFEVINDPEHDIVYMVMELMRSGVVMDMAKPDSIVQLSETRACAYFRQLVLAIEYLHARRIVHRDVKPSNLLLTDDGLIKLTDFGVSHYFEDPLTDFCLSRTEGTPAFLAPECCDASVEQFDARAVDIWACGVTLYCFLFGTMPFKGTTAYETYNNVLNEEISFDPSLRPTPLTPEAFNLLRRVLDKDAQQRMTMGLLRRHAWVTRDDTDPMPSVAENVGRQHMISVRKSRTYFNTDQLALLSPSPSRSGTMESEEHRITRDRVALLVPSLSAASRDSVPDRDSHPSLMVPSLTLASCSSSSSAPSPALSSTTSLATLVMVKCMLMRRSFAHPLRARHRRRLLGSKAFNFASVDSGLSHSQSDLNVLHRNNDVEAPRVRAISDSSPMRTGSGSAHRVDPSQQLQQRWADNPVLQAAAPEAVRMMQPPSASMASRQALQHTRSGPSEGYMCASERPGGPLIPTRLPMTASPDSLPFGSSKPRNLSPTSKANSPKAMLAERQALAARRGLQASDRFKSGSATAGPTPQAPASAPSSAAPFKNLRRQQRLKHVLASRNLMGHHTSI